MIEFQHNVVLPDIAKTAPRCSIKALRSPGFIVAFQRMV